MRILSLMLMLTITTGSFAQKVVDVNENNLPNTRGIFYTVGGQPVSNTKYVRVVDGSPYLYPSFTQGRLMLSLGTVYTNIMLKLDLIDHSLHYVTPQGEELTAATPVKTIWLEDPLTRKEIKLDNAAFIETTGKIEAGWYQLLDSGTVKLYKRHIKTIRENKPYGSATYEQYINNSYKYYILINSVFTAVNKIKALPDMLQDKKDELLKFIGSNNFSDKSDADYTSVIAYYNSLVKK